MGAVSALTLFCVLVSGVCAMSLLDAYRSSSAVLRRRGQQNTRFRPILHLQGDDDWVNQIGSETLNDQMMDENGVVYDLNPTANDRISTFFANYNSRKIGKK